MASVHRDRDKWRVKWRDAAGRQQSRTFRTKVDATAFAAAQVADKHRGVGLDPAGGRVTFTEYAEAWMSRQVWRPSTRTGARHALTGVPFGPVRLTQVRHADIQAWVAAMADRYSPTTVESRYRYVTAVFRAAKRDRLIADLPTDDVRLPKRMKSPEDRSVALDGPTLDALLKALPGPGSMWADYARFIALTGLRPSEAAGVTFDRIRDGMLTVDRQLLRDGATLGPPKTPASIRTIPLSDRALEIVASRPDSTDGFVFTTRHGTPPSSTGRGDAWRKARTVLADTDTPLPEGARGWHSLRHTYASAALAAGMDPATLSRTLGHATVAETLTTYSHALPGAMDRQRNVVAHHLGL